MQKLIVRNGCILKWAWLLPTDVTVDGSSEVRAVGAAYKLLELASTLLVGFETVAVADDPCTVWVCVGISATVRVWAASPALSPKT